MHDEYPRDEYLAVITPDGDWWVDRLYGPGLHESGAIAVGRSLAELDEVMLTLFPT